MSETFEVHRAVEPIRDEWDQLAVETGAEPFLRPGWVTAWQEVFGQGELEAHLLRRDGQLVALAPLIARGRTISSPTNWHTPRYEVLARDSAAATSLMKTTMERLSGRLRLRFAAASGPTATALAAAGQELGLAVYQRKMARSPIIELEGDFDSYRRRLSKNLRKNLSRRRTRLGELGEVELKVTDGGEDLAAALEQAFAIEASGWKGERGTAIASQAQTRAFYTEVSAWAARVGMLRLAFLWVGGTPLAFDLGFESDGVYYSLKTGYEAAHRRLGPGATLTHDLIRHCYESGLRRVDLLGAEDEFKRQWSAGAGIDLVEAQAFRGPTAPFDRLIHITGASLARRARERIRQRRR